MKTATITSKGQITIPLAIRNKLGLDKGDKVDFVNLENNQFAIIPATEDVTKLKGLVKKPRSPHDQRCFEPFLKARKAKFPQTA